MLPIDLDTLYVLLELPSTNAHGQIPATNQKRQWELLSEHLTRLQAVHAVPDWCPQAPSTLDKTLLVRLCGVARTLFLAEQRDIYVERQLGLRLDCLGDLLHRIPNKRNVQGMRI
jgi:hypothetical protein